MSASLTAWLRLTLTPGLGPAAQRNLLAAFGLPEHVFSASHASLVPVLGPELARTVLAPPDLAAIDTALAWAEAPDHYILTLADHEYPRALLDTPDPPTLLYVIGQPELLQAPGVAVVGARSATPQGTANAQAFAQALADAALGIVSGLALGIDTAAHQGALASAAGHTIAVVGTGADRVYPARNRDLAHRIAERGAIISEFPLGTPPLPHHFPRRNRILAGLARGVLVVEAAVGSGSLITARLAGEYGREVFAIPGSIHSPLSRGCHRLIREGAKLVETAQDVLEELGLPAPAPAPARTGGGTRRRTAPTAATTPALFDPADASGSVKEDEGDDDTARLLAAMGHDPVDIDTLAARSGLTLDALYAILLPLELDGRIGKLPGGRFQRL
ncbi:MAG: DNA-processing protein DprA [Rhodocyclaceae bacterium]